MGEGESTRQKRKKKPKPNRVAPSQSPHASKPLPSAPSLQTPTQSPAPGTPILKESAAEAAMRKIRKEQKVAALLLAQNPNFEEEGQGEEAVLATKKKHKERESSPSLSAAETPILEQKAKVTKKRKPSKEQEPSGKSPLPLDPGQTQSQGTKVPHASKPLLAAPFLEAPAQCPAPGILMLEEAAAEAAMRKRKVCKEQKVAVLPLAQNPSLDEEEQGVDAVLATKKKKKMHKELNKSSLSPSAAATAETPNLEQEAKVTKKWKWSKEQEPSGYSPLPVDPGQTQPQGTNTPHASKSLSAAPFIEAPAQSPAPGTSMLKEAAAAVMRKRKSCKEQKVAALSLAQNTTLEEQREDAMAAKMESKHMEHTLSSPSTSVPAETTIWEQEVKVTKKQKQRKQQEPSGKSPLPLDPGQANCVRSQGVKAPPEQEREADGRTGSSIKKNNGKRPRVRVLSKHELIKEASKKKPALPEGFVAFNDFVSSCTEQNPDHSSPYSAFFDQFRYNPVRGDHKPPLRRTPDRLARLPPRDHSSFESSQLTAKETSRASKSNTSVASKTKQLDSGSGSQEKLNVEVKENPSLDEEEQGVDAVLATKKKKKKHKELNKSSLSPSAAATAETPNLEQEAKVTKKWKWSKEQEPSGYSPLPVDPGQTQPQGTNTPHASKSLSAAPFIEAPAQSPAPGTPMLKEAAAAVMRKRKSCKEQKVAALSLAQNTTLEEQREDAMAAKMESKHMEHTLSSPSTSVPAETTIWEQEVKVTKKQKQRKQQEPSGKSPLPRDPGQANCVRSQGVKAPPEQEREADGRTGSSIKKNNGKRPRVRVLSKHELIKEASKKKPALPEGFVAFNDFVSSCTEQNPDHSSPYSAFFDQFRYNPVRGDHKPPLRRTPDRLARLPPRDHSSFESSQLTAKETSRASKSNTSVASKTKQLDSGSGSQEKLNVEVKENPQKKAREKKQRKPSGNSKASKANNSVAHKSKKKDSGSGSASGSQEKPNGKEKISPEKKMRPPLLTRAEKCSDKYRRVPLDQLVPPPRSPHNLLQEKYASDPWKVIVICMLLNLTQGKQVKNIIEGFFKCYPDAQSACNAHPDKMTGYLTYLGLQRVKTTRIQRFSKEYVEKEWTYITELCGVGKYAADAYAIFCAGRATEVVPKDHKLVDYWKYVCFELPMMQESQNMQEAGVPEQELAHVLLK